MEKTILNPDSPLYQKINEYSNKLSDVYKQIVPLTKTCPNSFLKAAVQEASKRAQQSIFVDMKNHDESIDYRNELLSKEPRDINDYLQIGNISLYLYDFLTSSVYFSLVLPQINFLNQGQLYMICITLMHYQTFQTALSILSPIADHIQEPYRWDAHYRCGIMYLKLLNYEAAIKEFNMVKEAEKIPWVTVYDVIILLSHVYFLKDSIDIAISVIESADKLLPGVLQQRCFLYLISNNQIKMEEGLNILHEHRATSNYPYLLYLQSRLYYKRGYNKEAFNAMAFAIKLKDDDPLYWLAMGNIYFISTQLHEASMCYNRAIMYDKDMIEAWINYGATLELDPSIGDALKFYQRAYDEGNLPIKREVLKRKKIIEGLNTSSLIPRIMEPNDKFMFKNAADMVISIYLNEIPKLLPEIVKNPESIVMNEYLSEKLKDNGQNVIFKSLDEVESSGYTDESEEEEDSNENDLNHNSNNNDNN